MNSNEWSVSVHIAIYRYHSFGEKLTVDHLSRFDINDNLLLMREYLQEGETLEYTFQVKEKPDNYNKWSGDYLSKLQFLNFLKNNYNEK